MKIEYPKLRIFKTTERFGYLWLKYVTGFDLSHHCAKCLLGEYSDAFHFGEKNHDVINYQLDEHPARYYYICGVTKPYNWKRNLHLAFEYAEGEYVEYKDDYTYILIENAKKIPIIPLYPYMTEHGADRSYNTCRNWRFAYQMTYGDGGKNIK